MRHTIRNPQPPQQTNEPGWGLITRDPKERVALRGVRVRARLEGMSQRTVVEQTFVNLEPCAIEAVYTFPLPDGAAVCGFEIITGDRVLTGRVEESDKALDEYEDAIADGNAAYMLESDRPDVFTARVGNLKPRQAATIRLTYVCALDRVDRSIRVTFPTTIAPRYRTDTGTDLIEAAIDGDALNPPRAWTVPYGMSLEVDVTLAQKATAITSPSHAITIRELDPDERPGCGTAALGCGSIKRITLRSGITEMDRDVVLLIDLKKEHEPRVEHVLCAKDTAEGGCATSASGRGQSFLAVTFMPEFDVDALRDPPPTETVFLLDCSGSMAGESIRQATAALELCLRSMLPGDRFNVCRFGSTFDLLAKAEPLVYDQHTLNRALRYIGGGASLGGTEIFAPLEQILSQPPAIGAVRQVIVLTDGQVSNEPAVLALARQHRAHNRIFSFGIGAASSQYLVNGLARATGGAAEFITAGERIEDKVLRTFARIASPMISDVEVDWGGSEVQTLAELPPVFDGDVLTVFGRVLGTPPRRVTLKCVADGRPQSWSVDVPRARDDHDGVIPTMWARRMIQSLEEVNDVRWMPHTKRDARAQSKARQTLLEVSKQFNIVCSLTSFIAIEHRSIEDRNDGRPALRRVPVQLARGWGGLAELAGGAAGGAILGCAMRTQAPTPTSTSTSTSTSTPMAMLRRRGIIDKSLDRSLDKMLNLAGVDEPRRAEMKSVKPREVGADDSPRARLHALLATQSADGWFNVTESLLAAVVPEWEAWRDRVADELAKLSPTWKCEPLTIWTALIVVILHEKFDKDRRLWIRASVKALRYVARDLGVNVNRLSQRINEFHPGANAGERI